jgi:hypothetical protein
MQADESAPPKAAAAPQEVATKSPVPASNAAVIKENVAASDVAPVAVLEVVATPETPAEQKTKSAKTSIKKDKKQDKKKEVATVQPAVAAVPMAAAFTNFATDYLVTPAVAGNRRRPGANMKGFMSMARDVKEMKKGSQGNQQRVEKKTEV